MGNKKLNKKVIVLLILVLTILVIFRNQISGFLFFSPIDLEVNALSGIGCGDSDGNLNLIEQSKTKSVTLFIHKDAGCSFSSLNKLNQSGDICTYALTYNDYCINATTLREKICENNRTSTKVIKCTNKCVNGLCS